MPWHEWLNDLPRDATHEGQGAPTPEQLRRLQLWRAMADLAKAQPDGRLTEEQARLFAALADNLQRLAAQLHQLSELGQACARRLDPDPAPPSH